MSELESAWDEIHAANTMSWQVGRPSFHDEARRWEQHAFDTERPKVGRRSREWIAVGPTEVACVREMARCLRELREGHWPRQAFDGMSRGRPLRRVAHRGPVPSAGRRHR